MFHTKSTLKSVIPGVALSTFSVALTQLEQVRLTANSTVVSAPAILIETSGSWKTCIRINSKLNFIYVDKQFYYTLKDEKNWLYRGYLWIIDNFFQLSLVKPDHFKSKVVGLSKPLNNISSRPGVQEVRSSNLGWAKVYCFFQFDMYVVNSFSKHAKNYFFLSTAYIESESG